MKINPKILLFTLTAIVVVWVSYSYLAPSVTLGDFSKFEPNSEISQTINVAIVTSRPIERSPDGKIISFYARDKNNVELKISPGQSLPEELLNAEVIELLGHLHGNVFAASRITKVK
ncbi:MAG: hypothetical protein EPO24_03575 [Bacteroidetes bacterium]|nr:MAG: hypothetical protein EPO24_03575 [Bacteroidota bacterium]